MYTSLFSLSHGTILTGFKNASQVKTHSFPTACVISCDACSSSICRSLMSLLFWNLFGTMDSSFDAWASLSIISRIKSTLVAQLSLVRILQSSMISALQYLVWYIFYIHYLILFFARVYKSKKTGLFPPSCKTLQVIECVKIHSHQLVLPICVVVVISPKLPFTNWLILVTLNILVSSLVIWHKP